ncbi:MAG: hypothetical protein KUG75_01185 [Pseudomonadales bacterium]|nr:hypothetical protein [Pseudomonadales bacterium]
MSTIFFCHAALASKPVMTRMLDSTTYQTELAAVTAMGLAYLEDSTKNDVEHMGAILKTPNGRFGITHGRNRPGKDEFRFTTTLTHPRSQLPKGMHTGKQISHIDLRNISRS